MKAIMLRTSTGISPPITSSSSRTDGDVASAFAISRRLRSPIERLPAGICASTDMPSCSRTSDATIRASLIDATRSMAPITTLSSTLNPRNG